MRITILILALVTTSCAYDPPLKRLEIGGYFCGDSLDRKDLAPKVWERFDGRLVGSLASDTTVELWTRHGYIIDIVCFSLDSLDIDSFSHEIRKIYGINPECIVDTTFQTKTLFWDDPVSGDQIKIYPGSDTTHTLVLSNPITTQWNLDRFPIEDMEYDFTPMKIE